MPFVQAAVAFFAAIVVGTLVEYFVHRLMHAGTMFGKVHAKHHQTGVGQGWWLEFLDYFKPSIAILWIGFLFSIWAGIGFVIGGLAYASMAAYAHQVQHERPELVFWLPRPVHHLHHSQHMWRHNFGILTDVWDRVFGTYKQVEWSPEQQRRDVPLKSYFQIKWF